MNIGQQLVMKLKPWEIWMSEKWLSGILEWASCPQLGYTICKRYPDGLISKFNARYCARGDHKIEEVCLFETYSPVVMWTTTQLMLIMECLLDLESKQGDVKCDFYMHTCLKKIRYMFMCQKVLSGITHMGMQTFSNWRDVCMDSETVQDNFGGFWLRNLKFAEWNKASLIPAYLLETK